MAEPLSQREIDRALQSLPGWSYQYNSLQKSYTFDDFREAVAFIVRLAFAAEEQNHHPDLHNVYNKVDIALSTHDADDQVTEKDVRLARSIESIVGDGD